MTVATIAAERRQSVGEEIANGVSHGIGLLGSLAALPVLIVFAARDGDATTIAAATVFGVTMVLLYLASTLYHALPPGRAKRVFLLLDHAAIYLLIAGTYTPFALGALRGAWGWSLFGIVWALAAFGIVCRAVGGVWIARVSIWVYLAMGWLVVIALEPLRASVPAWGIFWLVAGGLSYTIGAAFFARDRVRYLHFVWHLWVITGTGCHFVAALFYSGGAA